LGWELTLPVFLLYSWLKSEVTSGDVKANCEDLKVLGKGDFKALIKWRIAIREEVRHSRLSFQFAARS
jgi:hypothetical protein